MNTLKIVGLSVSLIAPFTLAAIGTPVENQSQKCCTIIERVCTPTEPSKKGQSDKNKVEESSPSFDTALSLMDMLPKIRAIITASGEIAEGASKMASGQGISASSTLDILLKIRTIITTTGELAGIARKVVDIDSVIKKVGALYTYLQQPSQERRLVKPVMLMLPKFKHSLSETL